MEFTEAFRTEDISKTDFFDFVVTPEDMGGDIVLHNSFPWSRKSGGLFGNNNTSINNANTNGPLCNGDSSDYRGVKEANNNHLLTTENASLPSFGDHTFWNTTASAKAAAAAAAAAAALNVNVKLESPSLEDLNDICWPSGTTGGNSQSDDHTSDGNNQRSNEKGADGNTDGSIYTLTVVNPAPSSTPTWYRPPENEPELSGILKEEEHLREAMSAIEATGQYHTSLDIDSIISILPTLPSMSESLHEHNGFATENHDLFNSGGESSSEVLRSDLLVSEKHSSHSSCEDSGFVDSKDDLQNRMKQPLVSSVQSSPQELPQGQRQPQAPQDHGEVSQPEVDESRQQTNSSCSFSENNNDWSFSNNETRHSAESLLRSALQGGKSFLSQYNGCSPHSQQHGQDKTLKCLDTHTELQAVQGGHTTPDPASLGIYMTNDVDSPSMGMIPVTMDNGSVLLFDDSGGGIYNNNQGSTSSQSMDDILLSPLEDYEKFKLIENEVAESAKRYGGLEHPVSHVNGMGHNSPLNSSRGPTLPASPYPPIASIGIHEQMQPHSSTPTKSKKKSNKKSSERSSGGGSKSKNSGATTGGSGGASSMTSSNGVRRERSLHHCTICSKAFKDKYSVNVHIRTHTGEKPFACSVCGKSFRQKAHLAKHYHTHVVQKTNEPLGPCKVLPTKTR